MSDFSHLCGWVDSPKDVEQSMSSLPFPVFSDVHGAIKGDGKGKKMLLHKVVESVAGYFPNRLQTVGDCISQALAYAVDVAKCVDIYLKKDLEEWVSETATEDIYSGSRNIIGKGRLGNGDGSLGIWAAKYVNEYGALARKKYGDIDLSKYDGNRARTWGRSGFSMPSSILEEAKKHPILTVSQVRSWEEVRDLIYNGYAVTIASNQGFSSVRDKDGFAKPQGNWAHAMCLVAMDDEYKRPAALCQNCFSDDAEILTDNGWFYFKDLPKTAKVATINIESGELEYQLPTEYQEYDYSGEMIHFHGRMMDCLVTPDHNMLYVSKWFRETKNTTWRFKKSKNVTIDDNFRKDIDIWNGKEEKIINILGFEIDMDIWLEFLGYFLSEGWANTRTRERKRKGSDVIRIENDGYAGISQNSGDVLERMKFVVDKLPWNFKIQKLHDNGGIGYQLISYNYKFAEYMKQFGKAHEKFIPDYVFNLSARQQMILFNSLMDGDGCWSNMRYTTNSKKLNDGFQRLCLHLGYSSDYNIYRKRGSMYRGVRANHDLYSIGIKKSSYSKPCVKNTSKVNYSGKVYCVTVPNHTVFIRRNGKTLFTGQSWGTWNSGPKRHDQPDGSFWIDAEDLENRILKTGDCWAYSGYEGFKPNKLNTRVI